MEDSVRKFERTLFKNSSDLQKAYRKVSLIAHPDKGGSDEAFKKLNTIYTDGLVWFKKSSSEFLYATADKDANQLVKGTPVVPAPAFMRDGFPMRWARQLVTACEVMYEYRQTKYGDFPALSLQFVINSVCRLKAYYEAWLELGASSTVKLEHFAQSWHNILYLSSCILEMRKNTFNPIAEELVAAFAGVEYSAVDISDIKITGESQLEKMFGDEVWAKAKQPAHKKKTFTEQEVERFVNEAKAEVVAEVAALSMITSEQAAALTKMERQIRELNGAKDKAEQHMKLEISKGEKKIKLMEKQLHGQLDKIFQRHCNVCADVSNPIGFPVDPTTENMEKEKEIIQRAYNFFDSIDINDNGDFCLRDALHAAFMMQYPEYTKKEIEKAVKNGVRKSGRHEKRTAEGTKKNTTNTVYQPFSIVARSLFRCTQLTEFCDMMTALAARELAPCPIRVAVLMLHLKDISMGAVNVNVAYNVLGLCERADKERYLLGLRTFANEKIVCMQTVKTKDGKQQICYLRAMKGKEMCSYHTRNLKFRTTR